MDTNVGGTHTQSAGAQQAEWQQMQAQQAAAAAARPAAAAAAPAGASDDLMTQLDQFAQLHQAGVLTDDEFAAAKSTLLAQLTAERSAPDVVARERTDGRRSPVMARRTR